MEMLLRFSGVALWGITASGHSWVLSPTPRGPTGPEDLDNQRYYCRSSSLDDCQPDPRHGVVLTEDALRPCRRDVVSTPMQTVQVGSQLLVEWAGNGHANSQSDGTCVQIQIAPFQRDPSREDFVAIPGAECLPYYHNTASIETNAMITLPPSLEEGQYTLFWNWNFTPFHFSSCMDINVVSEVPREIGVPVPESIAYSSYRERGCEGIESVCATYCMANRDECGRRICHGDSHGDIMPCAEAPPLMDGGSSTGGISSSFMDIYTRNGCSDPQLPPSFCFMHLGSYCKDYRPDECGRSICHGDTHASLSACS